MKTFYCTLYLFLVLPAAGNCQKPDKQNPRNILDKNFYQKVVLGRGEIFTATVDSIYMDTLVLGDGSTIQFQLNSVLIVENALVGRLCTLTSAGLSGERLGAMGTDGKDLKCIIIFRKLESLKIDTRGGNGMHGSRGMDGGKIGTGGNDGGVGKPGGSGGDAGNLRLAYLGDGFDPTINGEGPHNIKTFCDGGLGGEGGKGGSAGRPIRPYRGNGRPGQNGENGIPGRGQMAVIDKIR